MHSLPCQALHDPHHQRELGAPGLCPMPAAWPWRRGRGSGGQQWHEARAPCSASRFSWVECPGTQNMDRARGPGACHQLRGTAGAGWGAGGQLSAGEGAGGGTGEGRLAPSHRLISWPPRVAPQKPRPSSHPTRGPCLNPLLRWRDRGRGGTWPRSPGSGWRAQTRPLWTLKGVWNSLEPKHERGTPG